MDALSSEFNVGAIAPLECIKSGWATIKDRYWLFLGITLVAILIGGAVPIVLIGPMMGGLYLCLFAKMRGEPVEFGTLFKGFEYFVPSLIAAAIQTAPVLILVIGGDLIFAGFMFAVLPSSGESPPPIFWLGLTIFVLFASVVSLAFHTIFFFSYALVVDRKLSGWQAIKTSVRAALQNIGGLLGLIFLTIGLGILGVLACYVGVFFVMPIAFAAQAQAYRRVFPETAPSFPLPPPPPPGSWAA
jgi:hypothetical protein